LFSRLCEQVACCVQRDTMAWPDCMQPDSDSDGTTNVEDQSLRLYEELQPVVRALCAANFDAGAIAGAAGTAGLDNPYDIIGRCQAWRDLDRSAAQMTAAIQGSCRECADPEDSSAGFGHNVAVSLFYRFQSNKARASVFTVQCAFLAVTNVSHVPLDRPCSFGSA
jgi:hypothetical protein